MRGKVGSGKKKEKKEMASCVYIAKKCHIGCVDDTEGERRQVARIF